VFYVLNRAPYGKNKTKCDQLFLIFKTEPESKQETEQGYLLSRPNVRYNINIY
jgi:hypothetical protein